MNKRSNFQITKDDQKLIEGLWRWKLLTTSQIHLAVYNTRSIEKCYRRLLDLNKYRFIECFTTPDQSVTFWQLSDKGYQILDFSNLEIDSSGFRSENPEHDFWVNSIHLGAKVFNRPQSSGIYTEQEIRKINIASFPNWVPQTKTHRPDGWIKTDMNQSNDKSLIGLEVELSKKAPVNYSEIGRFYSRVIMVSQVLWFVKTMSDVKYIHKHLQTGSDNAGADHSFILMDHFIISQYQAKIIYGKNSGTSLSHILNIPNTESGSLASHRRLLDIRKYPVKSNEFKTPKSCDLGVKRYIRNENEV